MSDKLGKDSQGRLTTNTSHEFVGEYARSPLRFLFTEDVSKQLPFQGNIGVRGCLTG